MTKIKLGRILKLSEAISIENDGRMNFHKTQIKFANNTTANIDWTLSEYAKISLTANTVFVFTAPTGTAGGMAKLTLKITQDATGGRTYTFPASVKWVGNTPPVASGANKIDIITFLFDKDTNLYNGDYSLNHPA